MAEKIEAMDRVEDWKVRIEGEVIRVHAFELLVEARAARGKERRSILENWLKVDLTHARRESLLTCRTLELRDHDSEVLTGR